MLDQRVLKGGVNATTRSPVARPPPEGAKQRIIGIADRRDLWRGGRKIADQPRLDERRPVQPVEPFVFGERRAHVGAAREWVRWGIAGGHACPPRLRWRAVKAWVRGCRTGGA